MRRPPKKNIATRPPPNWTCPTCERGVATAFCPTCGEAPLQPNDLTLRGLINQVAHSLSSIDAPLLQSFRCLLTRPGGLTVAYWKGQRKLYTMPLPLFFFANVLFFGVQSLIGARIFSTTLDAHLHKQDWSSAAEPMVMNRIASQHTTLEAYAPVFNQAVALNAKSLIVLMVLPFALLLPLVFYRKRLPFMVHVVFSLHFYAFLLVMFCVVLAVVGANILAGGVGLESEGFDKTLSVLEVAICALYLWIATGVVYAERGWPRAVTSALLVVAAAGIVLGYRFVLLLITLYTT